MTSKNKLEEPLKALVFVDDCNAPNNNIILSKHTKLHNASILNWQLTALSRYGVQQVILLASDPIKDFKADNFPRLNIQVLSSPSWTCEGDALREVESRDDLRPVDDFILIRQGSVFNIKADELVAAHRKRREQDRNWLISTAFRKSSLGAGNDLVIIREQKSGTLISYIDQPSINGFNINSNSEHVAFSNGGIVELYSDILDVGVDVCSPEFLLEFRENFQFDHVRAYIKDKLDGGEAEVFGNRMYAHILDTTKGEYATRITSLQSLLQASEDVLLGWLLPITVDEVAERQPHYVTDMMEYEQYQVRESTVAPNARIGVGTLIENSVIGQGVVIGVDTLIRGCIIMDEVKIGDASEIEQSIIAKRSHVNNRVKIPPRCFIDENVHISSSTYIEPGSLVTMKDPNKLLADQDEEDSDNEEDDTSTGNGLDNENSHNRDSEDGEYSNTDEEPYIILCNQAAEIDDLFRKSSQALPYYESDSEDEFEISEMTDDKLENEAEKHTDKRSNGHEESFNELTQAMQNTDLNGDKNRINTFNKEVFETIYQAHVDGAEVGNTMLEINSLKLVYNCSLSETLSGILFALATVANKSSTPQTLYGEIINIIRRYSELTTKFSNWDDTSYGAEVVTGLANSLRNEGTVLKYLLRVMYDDDIVTDESILEWASDEGKQVEAKQISGDLLSNLNELLVWLAESDEESEESDE